MIQHYPWSYHSKTINVSPVYICIHFNLLYVIIGFSYSSFFKKSFYSLLHVYIRRTDAKAEAPVFWSSDVNKRFIGKVPDAGKDWGQKEKRLSEDEMAGWHHWKQSTWTWANSGRWWGTGRPGVLQSMGSQRVRQAWVTEQQQYIRIAVSPYFLN